MSSHKKGSGGDMSCLVFMVLALVAMPIVGIYLFLTHEGDDKILGAVLTVVGIILWIIAGVSN